MSRIKNKNTLLELSVRKFLFSHGLRYRIHSNLPGKPDIVFPKKNTVIFVNGCFWHQHKKCKLYVEPKTNTSFWINKIGLNVIRDRKNYLKLKKDGWTVLVIWECEIENNYRSNMIRLYSTLLSK